MKNKKKRRRRIFLAIILIYLIAMFIELAIEGHLSPKKKTPVPAQTVTTQPYHSQKKRDKVTSTEYNMGYTEGYTHGYSDGINLYDKYKSFNESHRVDSVVRNEYSEGYREGYGAGYNEGYTPDRLGEK